MLAEKSTLSLLATGLLDWRRWAWLGLYDIRLANRRSLLGMWWPTLSLGLFAFGVSILFSELLGREFSFFFPHCAFGWLVWGMINSGVSRGSLMFIQGRNILQEAVFPPNTLILRELTRYVVQFFQNLLVPIGAILLVGRDIPLIAPLALLGLVLNILVIHGAMLSLAVICARIRDVQHLVDAGMRLAFFLTPIIWAPESATERGAFIDFNPFYYMLEVIRGPFMSGEVQGFHFFVVAGLAVVSNLAGVLLFSWSRRRLIYWL
ncbi:ABC transporter permease [Maricaulis sp. CAU 1757]